MQLLRGIGRSLPRCRAQVVFNACVHLSGRVARLEEPDDPGVLVYGGKHIVQDEFFGGRLVSRSTELLDDSGDIGLLEKLTQRGEFVLDRSLLEVRESELALGRSELAKCEPDPAECGSACRNWGDAYRRLGEIGRGSKGYRASEDRRRHKLECQCPADAFVLSLQEDEM